VGGKRRANHTANENVNILSFQNRRSGPKWAEIITLILVGEGDNIVWVVGDGDGERKGPWYLYL
jgi:hypothetical protein